MKSARTLRHSSLAMGLALTLGLSAQASAGHETRSSSYHRPSNFSFGVSIGHGYDRHRSTGNSCYRRDSYSPSHYRHTYSRHGYGQPYGRHSSGYGHSYGHARHSVTTTKCVVRYFPGTTTKHCVTHHGTGFAGCSYHRPATTVTKCVVEHYPGTRVEFCRTHRHSGYAHCGWWQKRRHFVSHRGY